VCAVELLPVGRGAETDSQGNPMTLFKTITPALIIHKDGREEIRRTPEGRKLLEHRIKVAWALSKGICCLCGEPVRGFEGSLEHLRSKGSQGSKHDDRQGNLGISHRRGNVKKGSQYLEQYLKLPLDIRVRQCRGM
jgi:hypothetical protein